MSGIQDYLYGLFRAAGWSSASSQGAVASLSGESSSNLNTGVYQGEGGYGRAGTSWSNFGSPLSPAAETAGGIANWNGPRATAFYNWANANNLDPNSLDAQAQYVINTAPSYGHGFNTQATDYVAATNQFTRNYEQPAVVNARADKYPTPGDGGGSASNPGSTSDTGTAPTGNAFQNTLQQEFPNDPTLGGLYPTGQSWADTTSDVQQDYLPNGQLDTSKFGNMSSGPDVGSFAFGQSGATMPSQNSGLDATAPTSQNSNVDPYSFAGQQGATIPGGTPDASSYGGGAFQGGFGGSSGLDASAPTSQNSLTAMTPEQMQAMSPDAIGGQGGSGSGGLPDIGSFSPKALEGLPGPFQSILGGGANQISSLQSATSDFKAGTPQAQAKTPASTEGQIAEAKATEDEAKSVAKAAETGAKALTGLAKQQASTGQQSSATAAQDTASTVATDKSIASTSLSTLKDLTQRGFIAFFGLILLAGAVYYFSKSSSGPQVAYA